jgi:hypothetical protein
MGIRNVLTTLALAVIVACGGGVDPEVGNFAVATAIEPSTAHSGDSIVITVTETNVSSQPQEVWPTACLPTFQVFDSGGRLVGGGNSGLCFEPTKSITLNPGERYVVRRNWRGDVTRGSDTARIFLAPGGYSVIGDVCCGFGVAVSNTAAGFRVLP